jgi:hypothetical protein
MSAVRPTTRKKAFIAAMAIGFSVICLLVTINQPAQPEPTHVGKPVRYWARQSRHAVDDDSLRARIQIGAVAVPCLTNQLVLMDGSIRN